VPLTFCRRNVAVLTTPVLALPSLAGAQGDEARREGARRERRGRLRRDGDHPQRGQSNVEVRAEVFNLSNSDNFANPVGALPNALGTSTNHVQPTGRTRPGPPERSDG
jgi:hypothetical protein